MAAVAAVAVEEAVEVSIWEMIGKFIENLMKEVIETTLVQALEACLETMLETMGEECFETLVNDSMTEALTEFLGASLARLVAEKMKQIAREVHRKIYRYLKEKVVESMFDATKVGRRLRRLQQAMRDEQKERKEEGCKVLKEMDEIGQSVQFSAFFVHRDDKLICAELIKDEDLFYFANDSVFGPVVNTILSEFHNLNEKEVKNENLEEEFLQLEIEDSIQNTQNEIKLARSNTEGIFRSSCSLVPLPSVKVYNVNGSSKDRRVQSWIGFWDSFSDDESEEKCDSERGKNICFIAQPYRKVNGIVGGHLELQDYDGSWYILPICKAHNSKRYDRGGTVMTTSPFAVALRIPVNQRITNDIAVNDTTKLVLHACVKSAMRNVLPSIQHALNERIMSAVRNAGHRAVEYTKDMRNQIFKVSLIPIYGWVKSIEMVALMSVKCKNFFKDEARRSVERDVKCFEWDRSLVEKELSSEGSDWENEIQKYFQKHYGFM